MELLDLSKKQLHKLNAYLGYYPRTGCNSIDLMILDNELGYAIIGLQGNDELYLVSVNEDDNGDKFFNFGVERFYLKDRII